MYVLMLLHAMRNSGFNAEAVAELTIGLAISVTRRIVEFDRRLRAGETVPYVYSHLLEQPIL